MHAFEPDYGPSRIYSGPVIDRGILGENDTPETYASATPFFFVAITPPFELMETRLEPESPVPFYTKWLFEWNEERGGWLFMRRV